MSKTFSAPAILSRVAYLKDGGVSLGFSTNELTDEEKVIASKFYQKFGYVLFSESTITDKDIPKASATDESKSPSQRLRAALFVLWKQRGEKQDFEVFYRDKMEKFLDQVKSRLE